jgi:hypothetical protein
VEKVGYRIAAHVHRIAGVDWHEWHHRYDQPDSSLGRRLRVIQKWIGFALDVAGPGELRVVSLCAGQALDVLGVLPEHPRRHDVRARLVELDERNAEIARRAASDHDLRRVEVVVGDAALTDHYRGMVPADLVLLCGVLGNISDEDVATTIACCTQLCATGATLIWTRHRRPPDLVPQICRWLETGGFEQLWISDPDAGFGVGVHRYVEHPRPLATGHRMFTCVGYDALHQGAHTT